MPDLPLPKPQVPGAPSAAGQAPIAPPPSALVSPKPTVPPAPPTPPPGIPTAPTAPKAPAAPVAAPPPAPPGIARGVQAGAAMAPPPAPPKPTTPPPPGLGATPATPTISSAKGKGEPMFAKASRSPMKLIIGIVVALVLVGAAVFGAMRFFGGGSTPITPGSNTNTGNNPAASPGTGTNTSGKKVTLTYWGLWEPTTVFEEVLDEFSTANPNIDVNYVKQSHLDYRERLQTAVASQNGPDLFRYHASWTPMLKDELAPMPTSVMSISDYKNTFYPVAAEQLQVNGQIVGVPLMYDGLALYYNKEIFRTAGLQPPSTWAELKTQAAQLTVRSSSGIERGGLAIGNASNVEHFSDIIGLLMLQNGANLSDPTTKEAQEALQFYTNFVLVDKVWDDTLPSSTVAFARGDVAMMFAPSWRVHEIQALNPDLDFGITQVPTLGTDRVAWASYWAEGVNGKTDNKDEAWELIQYLSSPEVMKKLYSSQAEVRAFGEPYSRVDLADELADDELIAPFLADAPFAAGWYLSSYTHDNGINDQLIKYYRDAVNAVIGGKEPEEALEPVSQGTEQVLRQYGVN